MPLYSNILVPVSFEADRNARAATEIAERLRAGDGTLTLLHVMEQLPRYATEYLPPDHREKVRADIVAGLTALCDGLPGATVEVVEGHAGRTILDWAKDHAVDCIVIASHRPGLQDYVLGSTAAHVVRHAPCSVHVLR